jgi:DNA polymerase-3 subunit chi
VTSVDFHTGVEEPVGYLCRLLQKASSHGARVRMCAPEAALQLLDRALWTFDPQGFVPHVLLHGALGVSPALHRTRVWLTPAQLPWPDDLPGCDVLVRWQCPLTAGMGTWPRVLEVVSRDPAEQQVARAQWKQYEREGLVLRHHPADRRAS